MDLRRGVSVQEVLREGAPRVDGSRSRPEQTMQPHIWEVGGMSNIARRTMYAIGGLATFLMFIGHGIWAATLLNEKFAPMASGTLKNTIGLELSEAGANTFTRYVGFLDITLSLVLLATLIGALTSAGALHRFAYSRPAIVLYTWAAVWGFATAMARPLGAGVFWPEVLDVIERGPNFLVPLVVVATIVSARRAQPAMFPDATSAMQGNTKV